MEYFPVRAATWLMHFEQSLPLPEDARFREPRPVGGYGAFHGSELFYLFDTLDTRPGWKWTEADRATADVMAQALVAFARSGEPNVGGGLTWPRFTGPTAPAMHICASASVGPLEERERLELFDTLFAPYAAAARALGGKKK